MRRKPLKPKLWDIVQIDWLDSMHTTGWQSWENVDWEHASNTIKHKSVGYLAYQSADVVTILQSLTDMWKDKHPTNVDAVMSIPRSAITSITVLARKSK